MDNFLIMINKNDIIFGIDKDHLISEEYYINFSIVIVY